MEFYAGDKVIVNPLRIKQDYINELENNLCCIFTSTSRESATIIKSSRKMCYRKMKNRLRQCTS